MSFNIIDKLWDQYIETNPHVKQVYEAFVEEGEKPVNDHIALRTLDNPKIDINVLSKPFINIGYKVCGHYDFEVKKLKAIHLEHNDPTQPKVFISQLLVSEFSPFLQKQWKLV